MIWRTAQAGENVSMEIQSPAERRVAWRRVKKKLLLGHTTGSSQDCLRTNDTSKTQEGLMTFKKLYTIMNCYY